jgi:hypothetical protein
VYWESVHVGPSSLLTTEMRTLKAIERQENLLKWFILSNESCQWDFIPEKFVMDDSQQEVSSDNVGTEQLADDGFDKDYIVTHKKRKNRDRYYY